MCTGVTLCNTNPTWTGPGVKLCLVSGYTLCYIITCVNTEFFLFPSQYVIDVLHYYIKQLLRYNTHMRCAAVTDAVTCHSETEAHFL